MSNNELPIVTIALDQIEPYLCTSVKAVRRYEAMFRAGEKVPPISVERSGPGLSFQREHYSSLQ